MPLPRGLAADLRALREDAPPARDLWPDIAARLDARGPVPAPAPVLSAEAPQASPATNAAHVTSGHGRRRLRRRNAGYAAAAAVVLAVAVAWQLLPVREAIAPQAPADSVAVGPAGVADAPLLRAADALAREYQGALREVEASAVVAGGPTPGPNPGPNPGPGPASGVASASASAHGVLDAELERSAIEVRAALARDPDALHLFHRLQRIYAHRLALSLRQA